MLFWYRTSSFQMSRIYLFVTLIILSYYFKNKVNSLKECFRCKFHLTAKDLCLTPGKYHRGSLQLEFVMHKFEGIENSGMINWPFLIIACTRSNYTKKTDNNDEMMHVMKGRIWKLLYNSKELLVYFGLPTKAWLSWK
jgi:hypothetical protein